jgi:magnesium chelatase subunit I
MCRRSPAARGGVQFDMVTSSLPNTLGGLRRAAADGRSHHRTVKDEVRDNLIAKLRAGGPLFPGVVGYDDTVIPQLVNAILSKHNFILLGLRGQAKTRLLRSLVSLLDEHIPVVASCELRDDPFNPLCASCRARLAEAGDELPIEWLARDERYVEKLATPDVTIADLIGDVDPIKAARRGLELGNEQTIHYGLLPRANRGLFAINELPDLAGKIQVGLFNILQEGDVQIKGYPVRLRLDVLMAFTANPEDYTARGKIITPLKDRIGSEIRTHYAATRRLAMEITRQEAWVERDGQSGRLELPSWVREVVEEIAFQARADRRVDKRSGVSQRMAISVLENVASNAERRAFVTGEVPAVARISDVYAAMPAITGKFELEYEGELRGADTIGRELIRASVANVFQSLVDTLDTARTVEWFDAGGTLPLEDTTRAEDLLAKATRIPGLVEGARFMGVADRAPAPLRASAVEFILEGLAATKRISRSDEKGYQSAEAPAPRRSPRRDEPTLDDMPPMPGGKKKYYN